MSIVAPSTEVNLLIDNMILNFLLQKKRKIVRQTVRFSFIQPRTDTFIGAQLKTTISGKNLKLRVYITNFGKEFLYSKFAPESFNNGTLGPVDEVWVAYAELPRVYFKALSRLRHGMPIYLDGEVTAPFAKDIVVSLAEVEDSTDIFYLTSDPFPLAIEDQTTSGSIVDWSDELFYLTSPPLPTTNEDSANVEPVANTSDTPFFLTSPLFPSRGNEYFVSGSTLDESKLYRPAMTEEKLLIVSDIAQFLQGISPYTPGNYQWMRGSGHFYEALTINADISTWDMLQTFFPVDVNYRLVTNLEERLTIAADISAWDMLQTFFPVDYSYRRSTTDVEERLTVAADIIGFVRT